MVERIKSIIKKNKLLFLIIVIVVFLPLTITLSRYVKKVLTNYYFEVKKFYFTSDKLKENNPSYVLENWSGIENFAMTVSLESKKNELEVSKSDIEYDISYECSSDVVCNLSKTSGVVYSSTHSDNVTFTLIPKRTFKKDESTTFKITAKSNSPYVKTISATFTIKVGKQGITYDITDSEHSSYLMVNITNAKSYYRITEAFDSYNIGDEIDYSNYINLSEANKKKCVSTTITLNFNPSVVILDTTDSVVSGNENYTTTTINGTQYVNSITFNMDAISSKAIRFYKQNRLIDYTYPIVNEDSIVEVIAN